MYWQIISPSLPYEAVTASMKHGKADDHAGRSPYRVSQDIRTDPRLDKQQEDQQDSYSNPWKYKTPKKSIFKAQPTHRH